MKMLVIDTNPALRNEFLLPKNLSRLRNIKIDFAPDTNVLRFENFQNYVEKMEKEGPDWITPDDEVMKKIVDADIVLVHWCGVSSKMIETANKLKLIATIRSGAEHINVKAATQNGISVSISPSRLAEPVADMTIALMLSECRGLLRYNLRYNRGEWKTPEKLDKCNSALCNLIIGLVGYGGIARAVAKRLVYGFGSTVVAYDPFTPKEKMEQDGVHYVSLEELLKVSDIVSMHARLTEETKNIFGEKEFSQMKPTAIFINTARAGLVDEEAMIKALREQKIRGAGLDVYSKEPVPKYSPLVTLDTVTPMPHLSGRTIDMLPNSVNIIMKELERFLANEKLLFSLN